MRSKKLLKAAGGILTASAISGLGLLSAAGTAAAAPAGSTVVLGGEVVHNLSSFRDLGPVAASTPMTVGVEMAGNTAARDAAYQALFDPASPDYHHFYTPASFEAAFGVSQAEAQTVRAYAVRDGLRVVYSAPDGSYLELTGTTAQVESTFSVAEHTFRGADGGTFTANTAGPSVPAGVTAVGGLTSLTAAKTALLPPDQNLCEAPVPATTGTPVDNLDACVGAMVPADLRSIYEAPSADLGAGQKVAIFGEGELANVISDLRVFEKVYNQPTVPVREVLVGDTLTDTSGDAEWDLDSQAITGMAPDLQELDFYFGNNLDDPSITATYYAWANDPNGPLTGNSSFGGTEAEEYLDGFMEDAPLQQAAMEGRSMFVAAGDVGGSCLPGANGVTNTVVPCVEYPASSPYVTAVGGTVMYSQATPAGNQVEPAARALEYTWTYSGGGHSDFEPAPTWQQAVFPTGTALPCSAANTGEVCRGVPDVSALSGDILTNGYAYVNGGQVSEEGGTSLASPLWAGSWANVQAAFQPDTTCASTTDVTAEGAKNSRGAGFAQQDLYTLAANPTADTASFFNVGGTTDSIPGAGNGQQESMPRSPADPTGYSFVSGLGSPQLTGIIGNLDCGHLAATIKDTPEPALTVVDYGTTAPYNSLAAEGCPANGLPVTEVDAPDQSTPATGGYDLTGASITSDATSTTFTSDVSSAASLAADDVDFAYEFTYDGNSYAVTADTGPSPSAALYELTVTSTAIGLGVEVQPTSLGSLTAPVIDTTTNTVSVNLPFATFNKDASPTTPYGAGAVLSQISDQTNAGPAMAALDNDFNVDPVTQADWYQCTYTVTEAGVIGASVPEAPLAVGLPLAALAVAGVLLERRRRRLNRAS